MGLTWRRSWEGEWGRCPSPRGRQHSPPGRPGGDTKKDTKKETQTPELSGLPGGSDPCCQVLRGQGSGHQKCPALCHSGLVARTLSFTHRVLAHSLASHPNVLLQVPSVPDLELSHRILPVLMDATCKQNKGRTFKWLLFSCWGWAFWHFKSLERVRGRQLLESGIFQRKSSPNPTPFFPLFSPFPPTHQLSDSQ